MVKAFKQKESKRMTCHKKYKIRRKVREHNKKLAKTLKNTVQKKRKVDGKVPNMAPFKEDLLLEAIQQTQMKNDEKKLRKKTKLPLVVTNKQPDTPKVTATKSVSAHITLSQCDVLLWVVDVRSVNECLCTDFDKTIKEANKTVIFVLNKIDLVPSNVVKKWYGVLSTRAPTFVMKSTEIILTECEQIVPALKQVLAKFGGAKPILAYLKNTYTEATKIGVIGTNTVGKSSVVSTLLKCCGRTKAKRSVDTKLNENLRLVTTPGLIEMNRGGVLNVMDNLSQYMNYSSQVLVALSEHITKEDAMFHFTLPHYNHPEGLLDALAARYNMYYDKRPDHAAVGRLILKLLRDAKLKFYVDETEQETLQADIPEDMLQDVKRFLFEGDALRITSSNLNIVIVKKEKKKKGSDMDVDEEDEEEEEMGSDEEEEEDDDEGSDDDDEMS